MTQVARLLSENRRGEATRLMKNETPPALNGLQDSIAAFSDLQKRIVLTNGAQIKKNIESARMSVALLGSLALLIGIVAAYFAIAADMGKRRLLEQSQRVVSEVFENSKEGILITDRQQRIISVNKAFTEITGYAEHDVINLSVKVMRSGAHDEGFYERIWSDIDATDRWQGELSMRRRNGQIYPALSTVTAVRDLDRKITNYLIYFSDITERKEAESRIRYATNLDRVEQNWRAGRARRFWYRIFQLELP